MLPTLLPPRLKSGARTRRCFDRRYQAAVCGDCTPETCGPSGRIPLLQCCETGERDELRKELANFGGNGVDTSIVRQKLVRRSRVWSLGSCVQSVRCISGSSQR